MRPDSEDEKTSFSRRKPHSSGRGGKDEKDVFFISFDVLTRKRGIGWVFAFPDWMFFVMPRFV